MKRVSANAAGFTLLELLIATAIMGMIAIMLASGLHFGRRAWEAGEMRIDHAADLRLVQDLIRRQLGAAFAYRQAPEADGVAAGRTDANGKVPIVFEGQSDSVAFVGAAPQRLAPPGLYRMTLEATGPAGEKKLVLRQRRLDPVGDHPGEPPDGSETVLLDGVEAVRFFYFGRRTAPDSPEWHQTWADMETLPILVRLEVAFHDRRLVWPDLIVAPVMTADAGCYAAPAAARCQGG